MTIQHHPSDELLTAFAAGLLDRGQHIAIATHLSGCRHCRRWAQLMEHVGGAVLSDLPPTAMSSDAFARVEARLNEPDLAADMIAPPSAPDDVVGLPAFVRRYPFGPWKWIAPRVHLRPILLPDANGTRVFLLKSAPGITMLGHAHAGMEMTCVLSGSFNHGGGHYGPGDFDLGDETVEHQVSVGAEEECICLIAMQGELRFNGLIGRLIQPFLRM